MPYSSTFWNDWAIADADGSWVGHVDSEGALVVPSSLAEKLANASSSHDFYATTLTGHQALVFPLDEWQRIEDKLSRISNFNPTKRKFLVRTTYYGQVTESGPEKPLQLSSLLRKSADLHGEVLVLGMENHFRVYNLERLNQFLADESAAKQSEMGPAREALERARCILGVIELPARFDFIAGLDNCKREIASYIASHPDAVFRAKPRVFEELIAEVMKGLGYEVELTAQTRDGGADIIAIHKDKLGIPFRYVIECKRWRRQRKVSVEFVRSLYGVKQIQRADQAIFVTTSSFTTEVRKLAESGSLHNLALVDFERLQEWFGRYLKSTLRGRAKRTGELAAR